MLLTKFVPNNTIKRCCFCINFLKLDAELVPKIIQICSKKAPKKLQKLKYKKKNSWVHCTYTTVHISYIEICFYLWLHKMLLIWTYVELQNCTFLYFYDSILACFPFLSYLIFIMFPCLDSLILILKTYEYEHLCFREEVTEVEPKWIISESAHQLFCFI